MQINKNSTPLINKLVKKSRAKSNTLYVCTHDGEFHADDVLSTALLAIYVCEPNGLNLNIIRSSNPEDMANATIVYDVGGGEFDHHGEPKRHHTNGVPFAACGLLLEQLEADDDTRKFMYEELIYAVERNDNLFKTRMPGSGTNFLRFIKYFRPTIGEDRSRDALNNAFVEAVNTTIPIVKRLIAQAHASVNSYRLIKRKGEDYYGFKIMDEVSKELLIDIDHTDTFSGYGIAFQSRNGLWTVKINTNRNGWIVRFPYAWSDPATGAAAMKESGLHGLIRVTRGGRQLLCESLETAQKIMRMVHFAITRHLNTETAIPIFLQEDTVNTGREPDPEDDDDDEQDAPEEDFDCPEELRQGMTQDWSKIY